MVQPKSIGTFFDGTNNDGYRDEKIGAETNVFKLNKLYLGEKIYVKGVGTSENVLIDPVCQATGCGSTNREQNAMDEFFIIYQDFIKKGNNQPFIITDEIGFSRGAANARDYSNRILSEGIKSKYGSIPPELIILRSILPFDTVSSFGAPWNGIDIGKNFTTKPDTIVLHPISEDERRKNFGLQSIKPGPDAKLPSNWIEQSFPGDHSDIGAGHKKNEQGKPNDISKRSARVLKPLT